MYTSVTCVCVLFLKSQNNTIPLCDLRILLCLFFLLLCRLLVCLFLVCLLLSALTGFVCLSSCVAKILTNQNNLYFCV